MTSQRLKKFYNKMNRYTKEESNAISLYGVSAASSLMCIVPYPMVPLFGFCLSFICIIAAYIYRWRSHSEAIRGHISYLIRSFWWSYLFLTAGLFVFSYIILYYGDLSPVQAVMQSIEQGGLITEDTLKAMQQDFLYANHTLILTTGLACSFPYVSFLLYRTWNGVKRIDADA